MPSRTLEDKVEDLTRLSGSLQAQVHSLVGSIERIRSDTAETSRAVSELKTSVALLNQQIIEFYVLHSAEGFWPFPANYFHSMTI